MLPLFHACSGIVHCYRLALLYDAMAGTVIEAMGQGQRRNLNLMGPSANAATRLPHYLVICNTGVFLYRRGLLSPFRHHGPVATATSPIGTPLGIGAYTFLLVL